MMTTERDQAQSVTPLPLVNPGVPDSSDTSAQAPAEASSFEDQIAALKAENEKLQGQRKSQDQRFSKVQSEATSMRQIKDDLDDLRVEIESVPALLVKGFETAASGNTEDMAGALASTKTELRSERESQLQLSRYKGLSRRMEAFMDNEEAVTAWQAEVARQNSSSGPQSLDGFRDILEAAREAKFNSDLAAKDDELKTAREKFEEEYEVNDVNTGPSASTAGTRSFDQLTDVNTRKLVSVADIDAHKKELIEQIKKGKPPGA